MDTSSALYLFHHGDYLQSYEFFGAHIQDHLVTFRLWAPHAQAVSIVGDFNKWDPTAHPMKLLPQSGGVWERTISDQYVTKGTLYKYCIEQIDGETAYKADPYGFYSEMRPNTASVIWPLDYSWHDGDWCTQRDARTGKPLPMNIYEIHLGSWRTHKDGSFLTYRELAKELVAYLKSMHYTHVEIMPLMEHPFDGSWGYQITGYFAPTSRYGTPQDLMYLIDQLHQANIAVIFDWVPGHFCKDAHGLYKLDGTNLYEATEHPQWGTMEFDYNRPEVVNFLISNAYYWFKLYHVDGLRIDGVASILYLNYGYDNEWRKNSEGGNTSLEAIAFLKKLNTEIFKYFPYAIMAAEESTAFPQVTWPVSDGGLGFNYKWDMGWMHDTLAYMETDPYVRSQFHDRLTFSMSYAFSENFILPLSHDEVVHGKKSILDKMFGDYSSKFDEMRLLYTYMYTHSGKKLTFMGNENAPFIEWRYYEELEWFMLENEKHADFHRFIKDLNQLYVNEKALWQDDHSWNGFQWIEPNNAKQSVIIFRRMGDQPEDDLIIIINFCPQDYPIYEIGVPQKGKWHLLFNSNDAKYGGSGETIVPAAEAEAHPFHNQPYNITIALPGLSALIYKKETKLPARSSIRKPKKIDHDKKVPMKTSHKPKRP